MSDARIQPAQRINRLPPYLFARINALKLAKRRQGIDIIDLGHVRDGGERRSASTVHCGRF